MALKYLNSEMYNGTEIYFYKYFSTIIGFTLKPGESKPDVPRKNPNIYDIYEVGENKYMILDRIKQQLGFKSKNDFNKPKN